MEIYEHRHPNALVLKVHGRILRDSAEDLDLELGHRIDAGEERIVVDLTHLTSINAAGLRVLLRISRQIKERHGGQIVLCGSNGRVHEAIQASGLQAELEVNQSLDEACNCL